MFRLSRTHGIIFPALLLGAALPRGAAQDSNPLPDYSFRVTLPPTSEQGDRLSLPDLPIYDRDNVYLQVRDSSQDWYDPELMSEPAQKTGATSETLQSPAANAAPAANEEPSSNIRLETQGKPSRRLDAAQRILPDLKKGLFDESLAPIPPR
ncbi:MAG: hypothetical protein AAF975_00685 [Spirochaetota bacterium]